jgi:hypothetical protein
MDNPMVMSMSKMQLDPGLIFYYKPRTNKFNGGTINKLNASENKTLG